MFKKLNIAIAMLGLFLIVGSGSPVFADTAILGISNTGTDYVIPSEATVVDGSYPIQREVFLYVNPETTAVTKEFTEFVISDEGQDLATEYGFVKLTGDAKERTTDAVASLAVSQGSNEVAITGSTTTLQYITACAQQYTAVSVSVNGGGSGVGIADLLADRSDIAMSSRHIKATEIGDFAAAHNGKNPVEIPVAVDAIAIIVGGNVGVSGLTFEQLQNIFSGVYTNWSELGGNDVQIYAANREEGSGTRDYFTETIMKDSDLASSPTYNSNAGIVQYVSQTTGSIGYVGLGYALDAF
jgi:phosphate transport system substrate-binding protein